LLHPFVQDTHEAALKIAEIIEKENIEPFTIQLNQWSIIPHVEALEMDWEAMRKLPDHGDDSESSEPQMSEEDRAIQELIAREERIGREKRKKMAGNGKTVVETENGNDTKSKKNNMKALLQKQKQMYEEFNGPTVVVLEPDPESKKKLNDLRRKIIEGLFRNKDERSFFTGAYSPSSTVSDALRLPKSVLQSLDEDVFRPLVPIAAFHTVTSAMDTARKLRALWEPLTFEVTDLHLVSSGSSKDEKIAGLTTEAVEHDFLDNREYMMFHQKSYQSGNAWGINDEEWRLNVKQFGCDALVMLVGEEETMDDELNQEMVNLLCERGISGGYNISEAEANVLAERNSQKKVASGDISAKLDMWLSEDDDFDEGSVVVIGRTHFFTGEMRNYVGMPAFSATDGKYRALSDKPGSGRKAGAAYQKGSDGDEDSTAPPKRKAPGRQRKAPPS
jgi:hypothetical protein